MKPALLQHLHGWVTGFAWLIIAAAQAQAGEACALSVGWEPYGTHLYADANGAVAGADVDLMRALASEIGCEVSFKQMPWARHLLELKAGHVDVATSVQWSAERETFGWFSEVYRHNDMALFVRRGESARYRLGSLAALPDAGFRLGIMGSYYYGPEFAALMTIPAFARQVELASDYATNLRKLIHGRIDGVLANDATVVLAEAQSLGLVDRLERYPLALTDNQSRLLFSKQSVSPAVLAAVGASLARMKADGRLQRILDKYRQVKPERTADIPSE